MAENKKDILWRIYLVNIGFVLFGAAIIFRVAQLQFVEGAYWKAKADSLTIRYITIQPSRGNIYTADGSLLATSLPRYDVHIDLNAPGISKVTFNDNVDSLAFCLSGLFKDKTTKEYKRILKQVHRNGDRYYFLKRNISYSEQKALYGFPLFRLGRYKGGLIIDQLSKRERPFKTLAARTIGFKVEDKKITSVGIEASFDSYLKGVAGQRLMQRLSGNVWKPVNNENEVEPQNGSDVITTIDLNLQDVAENALQNQLMQHNADMGCAVLMEVATGEIKAIANLKRKPSGEYAENYNYAIGQSTEPGSTFKLASIMAALEDGYIDIDDSVDTQGGRISYTSGMIMRDAHEGGGRMSVLKAFASSSNVGISKIITKYYSRDPNTFMDRLRSMHIADPLGVQIKGEGVSRLKSTLDKDWSRISLPYISIGYESMLSPLQLLTFYNAVANNGKMVQPLFVKEIRNKGELIKSFPTKVIADSICSKATLVKARLLLEEVVKSGTANHIKHAQYSIAGKTGTAQIAQGAGGYKEGKIKYQASFCGYFPADKPRYSCIVVVYSPGNDVYYGASVACPVFKEIADKVYALNVDMHDELKNLPDSLYAGLPLVKAGNAQLASVVNRKLNIPVAIADAEWIDNRNKEIQFKESRVPNVVGMGLRDAIYLLEEQGLFVKPLGRGTVTRQSINAGGKIIKGQQIIIELS